MKGSLPVVMPLFPDESQSLAKKHLSPALFSTLRDKKTDSGFTLKDAIKSGIKNPDSSIGIYAGNAQSYDTFSPVFDPVISEYHDFPEHRVHSPDIRHLTLPNPDPGGAFIVSTRIRVARNIAGFDFPCHISLPRRREMEHKITTALSELQGIYQGKYHNFETIGDAQKKQLIHQRLWFPKGDRFQDAAGINSDYPKCRGIYHTPDKKFMIWVNEEDHLRIIGMKKTADISGVYNHLFAALKNLGGLLAFARHERYGYLTSCPTNLGTAMRAGVHIRLEKLAEKKETLEALTRKYQLQIRGTSGEKTRVKDALFDISNRQRLGMSEADLVTNFHEGLLAIIETEKKL